MARNILGLPNPHRPAPGVDITFPIWAARGPEGAGAGPEKEGGRGIDKASSSSLGLTPKPKALSR